MGPQRAAQRWLVASAATWLGLTACSGPDGADVDAETDPDDDVAETDSDAVDTEAPETEDTEVPPTDSADTDPEESVSAGPCPAPESDLVRCVPAGTFVMGSPTTEPGRDPDEAQVTVTLSTNLWVMRSEVTQGLFREVTGRSPSRATTCGDACPVEQVSWFDAVAFANLLSVRDGLSPVYTIRGKTVTPDWSADGWRLPTEAEWERAARGGEYAVYAGGDVLDEVGWYILNAGGRPVPVCSEELRTNAYDLCDMTGNIWEWTWDWYAESRPGGFDPRGPDVGTRRVWRGGAWNGAAVYARVANRLSFHPDFTAGPGVGFRLVRIAP